MLEKVTESSNEKSVKRKSGKCDTEEVAPKRKKDCDDDKMKSKPVALVPPRMQNTTVSPSPSHVRRGKQKRRSKDSLSDSPSKSDHEPNRSHHRHPLSMSSPYSNDVTQYSPFHMFHSTHSMQNSPFQNCSEPLHSSDGLAETPINRKRYPELTSFQLVRPRSDPREYHPSERDRDFYPGGHSFYDATRSLLQMNYNENMSLQRNGMFYENSAVRYPSKSEILNSSFPPHVSTTAPFWQQYSNLAKTVLGQDTAANSSASVDFARRQSDGSTTDTASNSSLDRTLNSPASMKINSPPSVGAPPMLNSDKQLPTCSTYSPSIDSARNSDASHSTFGSKLKQSASTSAKVVSHSFDKMQSPRSSKFGTKHFITQSAIASFPHLSKNGSLQSHSVNSLLTSQQSILEKAALKSNLGGGTAVSSKVTLKPVSDQVASLSISSKDGLHHQSEQQDAAGKSLCTQSLAAGNEEVLRQFGRQLSLQSAPSQSKILLSEVTLPIKTTMFSSPLMTYHQIKPGTSCASSGNLETRKQFASVSRPGSVPSVSVASSSMTGVVRLNSPTDLHKKIVCTDSRSMKSPSQSALTLPLEFKVTNMGKSKIPSGMTIYKPGTASITKSGKKSGNVNKAAKPNIGDSKRIEKRKALGNMASSSVPTTYPAIVPSPSGRVLYQNPVMTILPTHSRLLVVSNAATVTTSASSYQTVLYINSQSSTQKTRYPIASSGASTVTGSITSIANPLAGNPIVTSTVPTSSIVATPAITEAVIADQNSSTSVDRTGSDSPIANTKEA